MQHSAWRRSCIFVLFAWLVAPTLRAEPPSLAEVMRWPQSDPAKAERTVFLGCELNDAEIVECTTNLVASGHPGVFLLDSVAHADALRHFLHEFEPAAVVAIGKPRAGLDRRVSCETL